MGLTDNQKHLINAVADNNLYYAKRCALACVASDKTEKNKQWCEKTKEKLSDENSVYNLSSNLKNLLYCENTKDTFIEGRYFLTEREKSLYEHILKTERVSQRLTEMNIKYLNATLLYGESGTGKTLFGRFVAHELDIPFFYLKLSGVVDSYMGQTSKNISSVFEYIKQFRCVLLLDEIDCISHRRSSEDGGTGKEMSRITITIMQELDNLHNGTILLAATNRLDIIDEAILRRFTKIHEVKPILESEKKTLINLYLNDVGMSLTESEIETIIKNGDNQSKIVNLVTEKIIEKVYSETE